MKYIATLNGKRYEVEIERINDFTPVPRGAAAEAIPLPLPPLRLLWSGSGARPCGCGAGSGGCSRSLRPLPPRSCWCC